MKIIIQVSFLFLIMNALPAFADVGRDALVANALNCVDQHRSGAITWNDVCEVPQAAPSTNSNQWNDQGIYQAAPLPAAAFIQRVHTFTLAPTYFYFHYSEPQKNKRITGGWKGFEGEYTFRPAEDSPFNTPIINYYAVQGMYATGRNTWGSNLQRYQSDNSFVYTKMKSIQGYTFDGRLLVGKDLIPLSNLRITPYTGVGARYETDHEGNLLVVLDDGSQYIPDNQSNLYYYVPTGFTLDLAATDNFEITWNNEYDYIVKGFETVDYAQSDVFNDPLGYGSSANLRFSITHGWGARSSIRLLKHFPSMDLFLEPYVRYWHVGTSKSASGIEQANVIGEITTAEDKNSSVEIGSSLGVQF